MLNLPTSQRAVTLALVLVIAALLASSCAAPTLQVPEAAPTETPPAPTALPTPSGPPNLNETYNILVMGVDHRPTYESWRTDSVMVAAIDFASGKVGVISIPRDLYVEVPGRGMHRINEVDYLGEKADGPGGGPRLLAQVVENELGIPTQHYARIQMDGLVKLVDALGGVTVRLDCPLDEATPDPNNPDALVYWSLPAGDNLLDGLSAKKFATYRYLSSDFSRVARQQQLLWAIRNRALQSDVIARIPELWQALSDLFVTDLKLLDVITLARVGTGLEPGNVHGLVLGSNVLKDYTTPEGWSVLVVRDPAELEAAKAQLFEAQPLSELGKTGSSECP
jgi:LCP family protein required for cell wall assembly